MDDSLFVVAPIICICLFLALLFRALCPSSFANTLVEKEKGKASCFTLIVFPVSCDFYYSVALPHGVMGWSAVCDCGIS